MRSGEVVVACALAMSSLAGCGSDDCSSAPYVLESGSYRYTPTPGTSESEPQTNPLLGELGTPSERIMTVDRTAGTVTIEYSFNGKRVVERYRMASAR